MAFSFSSIGHAFATGLHDVYTGAKAVATFIEKIDTTKNQELVESLTSLVPGVGAQAVTVERGVFAVAGEVAAILDNVTGAGETALLNAGFDASIIADFKALIASFPQIVAAAKAPATTTATPAATK